MTKSWRDILPVHPAADLFPMMSDAELKELGDDIKKNGLEHRPVIWVDKSEKEWLLDGRNRLDAMERAGLRTVDDNGELDDDIYWSREIEQFADGDPAVDPYAYVISTNIHRRHLTAEQKLKLVEKVVKATPGKSDRQIAEQTKTSPTTVGKVRKELEATGDVSTVDTRTDSRGRQQPAHKTIALQRDDTGKLTAESKKALGPFVREMRDDKTEEKKVARAAREAALGAKQLALPDKKYGVILTDCEWQFEPWSRETGMDRAAENHYPTSTLDVIKSRDVPSIAADDAVLFHWATVPMLPQALDVMAAWGFTYKTHVIWYKDYTGTGYWFINRHELLLVGTKGNPPPPALGMQWPSVIKGPVREHSVKPDAAYEIIESYFPTLPKIELNARRARAGWDCCRLEAPSVEQKARDNRGGANQATESCASTRAASSAANGKLPSCKTMDTPTGAVRAPEGATRSMR
jgi:N6-adenosine-specific RNA methylase IME4